MVATDNFIDRDKLLALVEGKAPTESEFTDIINRSLKLGGLGFDDVAALLRVSDVNQIHRIQEAAKIVKETIYGSRLVLFAPLYTGNKCSNSCTYCAFRQENKTLKRTVLSHQQIENEVKVLLKEGHKRVLMLCGESEENPLEYFLEAIRVTYKTRVGKAAIKRVNVEIAPLDVPGFQQLAKEKIGTYACFQETYDPVMYKRYHPKGPKADYEYRLNVMDRAMEGGISDVGVGVLFGLADYRFEVLGIMEHAAHLEKKFGCGPHTVSVPRIEPAEGAPLSERVPHPVSDDDFKKIIAIIRIALPYTGIILSTRESESLRNELFQYGISQISAGSRTNPGAYSEADLGTASDTAEQFTPASTGAQFSLGDHRSLEEVINTLIDKKYVPSFCTGCYRKGRIGADFMDLAKPGLIKEFCEPNAYFTFKEYLHDFASEATRVKGMAMIDEMVQGVQKAKLQERIIKNLDKIEEGQRDVYF